MIALLAGFLRAWLDLTDFNQSMWLDRFQWHRDWKTWKAAVFMFPLDRWHMLAMFHSNAIALAGWYGAFGVMGLDVPTNWYHSMHTGWFELQITVPMLIAFNGIYLTSKTVFYESLLRSDPIAGLIHFWHAFRTPWKFDP